MKIGIYNEPAGGAIGGAEVAVAVLAETLSHEHEVEIVHHRRSLTIETLAEFAGTDLSRVCLRHAVAEPRPFGESHDPRRRFTEAQLWHRSLSEPYDLFINFSHRVPPFCHAPRGVLMSLFPIEQRPYDQARTANGAEHHPLVPIFKKLYHEWEWKRRMNSYQQRVANSEFTRTWLKRRWGIDSEVIYPPGYTNLEPAEKTDTILSVGRFATQGHSKRQLEMMSVFRELVQELSGWEYFCAGALDESETDRDYFEKVRSLAVKGQAHTLANVRTDAVRKLYAAAKIFWHAAGYGEREDRPELFEHFGQATVEAMAAGCVPIVINRGGQAEVVEHGINGFLWSTLDELKYYTVLVARDEALRIRISELARQRAEAFSRRNYVRQFRYLLAV